MRNTIFILIILSIIACTKQAEKKVQEVKKKLAPEMTIKISHKTPKTLEKDLDTVAKFKNWKEYNELKTYIKRFEKCSPNEALNYANELKKIVGKFKRKINIQELKTNAFKARVNVLNNEALRLYDMTLIPAITPKEVNSQVAKICSIYSNMNTKINTVFKQNKFNEDIDLDNFFKLDKKKSKNDIKKPRRKLNDLEAL